MSLGSAWSDPRRATTVRDLVRGMTHPSDVLHGCSAALASERCTAVRDLVRGITHTSDAAAALACERCTTVRDLVRGITHTSDAAKASMNAALWVVKGYPHSPPAGLQTNFIYIHIQKAQLLGQTDTLQ